MLACLPASTSHHPSRKALPAACRPPPPSPPPPHPPSLAAAEGESEPHLIGDAGEQGDRGFERATRKVYSLVSARDLGQLQRVRGGGVGPCGAQCCERGWGAEGVGGGGGGGRGSPCGVGAVCTAQPLCGCGSVVCCALGVIVLAAPLSAVRCCCASCRCTCSSCRLCRRQTAAGAGAAALGGGTWTVSTWRGRAARTGASRAPPGWARTTIRRAWMVGGWGRSWSLSLVMAGADLVHHV